MQRALRNDRRGPHEGCTIKYLSVCRHEREALLRSDPHVERRIRAEATSMSKSAGTTISSCPPKSAMQRRRASAWNGLGAKCGHGHRSVKDVLHRRPWSKSSTADASGSAALNSATKARTLRRVSPLFRGTRLRLGAATSTGTMAAAGFPWRKIKMRFFLCSAWSTSSER
jgi:hypothetical protein